MTNFYVIFKGYLGNLVYSFHLSIYFIFILFIFIYLLLYSTSAEGL